MNLAADTKTTACISVQRLFLLQLLDFKLFSKKKKTKNQHDNGTMTTQTEVSAETFPFDF